MKQIPSDKYTIAWFKLAEFISRGEKEKALGIYKLLALSIDDAAFTNKLEGDILFLFNDKLAIDKHYKSATLYQKEGRFIEAAAIFENLSNLYPESIEYLYKLIDVYKILEFNSNLISTLKKLFVLQQKRNEISDAVETLEKLESFSNEDIGNLFEEITFELINKRFKNDVIVKYLKKTIDAYFLNNNKYCIEQFLVKLETISKSFHKEAIKQIDESHNEKK